MDPTSVSEGKRVTLRCRTKCTVGLNPTYIWYKNGQRLTNPITSYNSLILDPVCSEDAGNYSCALEGFERIRSPEETLTVRYGPKSTSVSVSPSGGIVEGSSSVHPDPNSDMNTALNMRTMSPDYDTLATVHPDPNCDTYTHLNMKTRSPEYDTLARVDTDEQDGRFTTPASDFAHVQKNQECLCTPLSNCLNARTGRGMSCTLL
ncbi:hypothetical protein J4Q44_G00290090 [Coregonus suidteri]|uniref:Ig-like domain-containing protein n=1 Tax=Coregonus suidteri TaxID=861788 RepID=A0AAN8L964_9TELE